MPAVAPARQHRGTRRTVQDRAEAGRQAHVEWPAPLLSRLLSKEHTLSMLLAQVVQLRVSSFTSHSFPRGLALTNTKLVGLEVTPCTAWTARWWGV